MVESERESERERERDKERHPTRDRTDPRGERERAKSERREGGWSVRESAAASAAHRQRHRSAQTTDLYCVLHLQAARRQIPRAWLTDSVLSGVAHQRVVFGLPVETASLITKVPN